MTTSRLRPLVVPGLVALAALAVLIRLGSWQLSQLAWKNGLIAQVEARTHAPPVPLPPAAAWPAMTAAADEYRRVAVTGSFRHDAEAYLYTVAGDSNRPGQPGRPQGQGYLVLTPLVTAEGATVLVNRGFVPTDRRDPATRQAGQTTGPVTITGLVRFPERRSVFAASDDLARRLFYTRDTPVIAQTLGFDRNSTAPFSIDADATPVAGGLPQGGETRLSFPNRHFEYALTWFGLALTLIGVFAAFAVQKWRGTV
ncbi:SURF1 family protein [Phreatobacter stygius]|uniref:SURF1-like protein n=1 Tax=Phreatobacter stygius TaxID=1940610 RepID=A0A4D7B3Y8_9HYPH|nr:SURF1 family protein [Phreatobacter stygius]QCI65743.1 SURF1 family protein [Phreatobacter stygius]